MNKHEAVASLGQSSLLQPARVREALKANDRLKLGLTVLQAAAAHASTPERPSLDLAREIAAADIRPREEATWLREWPARAARHGRSLYLPEFARLTQRLAADLATMARPVLEEVDADPEFDERVKRWDAVLRGLVSDTLDDAGLASLTHGKREAGDSLHLLVMDLHKALNRVASRIAGEDIAGAHCWGLGDDPRDRVLVGAFMRGLNRTRGLKLDHPGLDTAATRDGDRVLIQNDIGTNDAHVLVLQVEARRVTLTYSDLHRQRFTFFQQLLAEVGAQWSETESRTTPGLNAGEAYHLGTATFEAADDAALEKVLEGIGERIVFLIDWNRARKRLLAFVDRSDAVAVLREAAARRAGHMAWLAAGGERLVWNAMAVQGDFRLGDRLDGVLGDAAARELLVDVMQLAHQAVERGQPLALVADETRLLLARRLLGRRRDVELLQEHAGLLHALAQALRDGLAHGAERDAEAAEKIATRAKDWERQADELVMRARAQAERQPQRAPFARLMESSDNVADALEEACFVLSLVADGHHRGWGRDVRAAMQALADAVLTATQDHVKALAVAATLGESSDAVDHDDYLDALWRVLQAERQCDELLRSARRALAREVTDAASLGLGNELAAALEQASDHLLALAYGVRQHALRRAGGVP